MRAIIQLMRPKHWVKNILVLLPAVFAGQLTNMDIITSELCAFASFCLVASAVYVINDLNDADKDRSHPTKSTRPIASGAVSGKAAVIVTAVLIVFAALLQLPLKNPHAAIVLVVYIGINIGYSLDWKNIPIVDVFVLASGYILRVYYGGFACDIVISSWLYLTVLSASFYMGLGKRRGELVVYGEDARLVLKHYTVRFFDKMMYMFLGLANVFYALWARDAASGMLITVPIVMLISMTYSLVVEGASDGDPLEVMSSDKRLIILAVLLIASIVAVIYMPNLISTILPWDA